MRLAHSTLFGFLLFDQLVLPMFNFGFSFKISYFLLVFWFLRYLHCSYRDSSYISSDSSKVALVFASIMGCVLLGELYLTSFTIISTNYQLVRTFIVFIFCILAFSFGRSLKHFNFNTLFYILFTSLFLNFLFIIFKSSLPSFLVDLYVPDRSLSDKIGFESAFDILNLARPRGLFGNPNVSMLLININVLFIVLVIRNKLFNFSKAFILSAIVLPISLAIVLGTRSGLIVAIIQSFFLINSSKLQILFLNSFSPLIIFLSTVLCLYILSTQPFLLESISRFSIVDLFDFDTDTASNLLRPVFAFDEFWSRFLLSPFVGSGISPVSNINIASTQYFHNDVFYILAISGLIGFFCFTYLIYFFAFKLGWPILIPFFLPGLTSTFLLNFPALLTFFALTGLILSFKQRSISDQRIDLYN